MDTNTDQAELAENLNVDESHTSAIFDIIAKVKATARVKQRSVENLIESAQATQGKVLQRFNDHIDLLELEKVRLKKETESYKAVHDKIEVQLEAARIEKETLLQEKKIQTAGFEKIKNDFDQKLTALSQENSERNSRILALEKEAKALLQRNSELDQKNQTLQIDWNKLKKDHSDTLDKLETAQAEFARQQQIWQSERGELGGKVESIETAMEEFKADSIRKVATLTAELDHLRVKVSEAENERKKAEAKLVKFQKAWDQLEG